MNFLPAFFTRSVNTTIGDSLQDATDGPFVKAPLFEVAHNELSRLVSVRVVEGDDLFFHRNHHWHISVIFDPAILWNEGDRYHWSLYQWNHF